MWRLFRNFSNCDFNKHLTQHLRKLVQTLKIKRADPFNVCLRHQANPISSLLLRYTIRLNIANIFFSFFFFRFRRPKSLRSQAMSFSDSGSSSNGGDYKTFRQITRESELLLPILCFQIECCFTKKEKKRKKIECCFVSRVSFWLGQRDDLNESHVFMVILQKKKSKFLFQVCNILDFRITVWNA